MKIVKGNEVKTVTEKLGKIAVRNMGWAEVTEAKRPTEIGTRTKKIEPPIITDGAIILKDTEKIEYPGDEVNKPADLVPSLMDSVKKLSEKKTRKPAVRSKSKK